MKRTIAITGLLLASIGCGGAAENGMGEMEGEDHSGHLMGNQGTTDTTGALVRNAVHLTEQQERALGVVYTTVRRDSLVRNIRTVGHIQAPEPGVADVTLKIDGFVEELFVDYTGDRVRVGQPLLRLYAPVLLAAQEELLIARRLYEAINPADTIARRQANETLESARMRLELWDITSDQIDRIESSGRVEREMVIHSPVAGIVLEKDVLTGQRVMAGTRLYRIADLNTVWVEGEIFEQDLQFVDVGSRAHIEVAAYPGEHVMGTVSFVYPTVDERSRTNRVRVTVRNPNLRLKPGMFATVFFDAMLGSDLLVVPLDAVVVTGERNLVFVRSDDGSLNARNVVLGSRSGGVVQILAGLQEGETIVSSANFLVDAESRLGASGGSMPGMQHGGIDMESGDSGMSDMADVSEDDMGEEHNHD